MLSDAQRHDLYAAARDSWGEGPAEALMALSPPTPWAEVARQSDIALVRGEMAELRGEMAGLRGEMAELRAELRGDIAQLRGHVDAQFARMMTGNLLAMIGVAGLVLAAGKIT